MFLSTYILAFHISNLIIPYSLKLHLQCRSIFLQWHDISVSVDYIAKHKPISSFSSTKVNLKFSGFWRFFFVAIIFYTVIILEPSSPPSHHFIKGAGWGRGVVFRGTFRNFHNKWGVQIFSIKNERLVKQEGCFKKGGITYFPTNQFFPMLSF